MDPVAAGAYRGLVAARDDPDELTSEEKQRSDLSDIDADRRDLTADVRDRYAEVRDHNADVRDHNAEVRDHRVAAQPDPEGTRRKAARDRQAAARDRAAADDDRQQARTDRDASRWDRSMAQEVEAHLLEALNDTDDLAESILLLGQAQGLLMDALDGDATEALIELEQRAARAGIGLQEAARQIIAERRAQVPVTNHDAGVG